MRTLLFLLLVAGVCQAQNFSESFENQVERERLEQQSNWSFSGMSLNKDVVINDTAIVSGSLTASRSAVSGWLYIDGDKTVSFKTRAINLFNSPRLQMRLVSLTGDVTTLQTHFYLNTNIVNHTVNTGNVTGWYKLEWFWPSVVGGNVRVALDDISSDIPLPSSTFLSDLAVGMSADKTLYNYGEEATYTVTIDNNGPDALHGATFQIAIPNAELISDIQVSGGTFDPVTRILTVSTMTVGSSVTLTFKSLASEQPFSATLLGLTNGIDYDGGNNNSSQSYGVLGPLPVTLTSFTARPGAEGNQLAWQTASEKNSDYFAIERGVVSDGRVQFEEIGRQRAAGNTALKQHYTFLDVTAPKATVQYRLRMVDRDGSTEYSPIITVAAEKEPVRFLAYPNPSRDQVSLQASQSLEEALTVQVVTATGAQVQRHEFAAGQPLRLSLAELPAGVYRVLVAGATTTQALTVTKW